MAWHNRLLNLLHSRRLSRELDREMAFHLAERTDDLVAGGLSEAEAAREAKRRFGNYGLQKERTREVDVLTWLETLVADLRYALRSLRASPGFALVAILSLALGIGANTAIFSLIDAVMLKYLPVSHPEQLVMVKQGEQGSPVFTNPLWEQIRDRQDVFADVFAVGEDQFDLSTGGEAHPVWGNWVSGDFFSTLGVRPAVGRTIARSDDRRGCPSIAVLSYGFWQSSYGGDPNVIGRTISLESHPFQIVGVSNEGFSGVEVGRSVKVYAPLCASEVLHGAGYLDRRSVWYLHIIGRPKPAVTLQRVNTGLHTLVPAIYEATLPQKWSATDQTRYLQGELAAIPMATGFSPLRQQYRGALLALMAMVGIVLLIACANVANLLLARATVRQREMAVRLAVGAGRWRLIRQLLTESMLLSLCGAVLGTLFATWSARALVGLLWTIGGHVSLDVAIDARVLAFTIAVALGTGLLFGLAPA
ncbi:MAG TPA: ABC transporter permease, partial [Gemmatimonadaceae bacterium]|nr:ABC transporter permease [Gemmatimonadaceae bacterium]